MRKALGKYGIGNDKVEEAVKDVENASLDAVNAPGSFVGVALNALNTDWMTRDMLYDIFIDFNSNSEVQEIRLQIEEILPMLKVGMINV